MDPVTVILIVLVVLILVGGPYYGGQQGWGPGPYGGIGLVVLLIVLYLLFGGRLRG